MTKPPPWTQSTAGRRLRSPLPIPKRVIGTSAPVIAS